MCETEHAWGALPVTEMVPVGVNLPLIPETLTRGLQMVSIGLVRVNSTVIDAFEHGTVPDCAMVPDSMPNDCTASGRDITSEGIVNVVERERGIPEVVRVKAFTPEVPLTVEPRRRKKERSNTCPPGITSAKFSVSKINFPVVRSQVE